MVLDTHFLLNLLQFDRSFWEMTQYCHFMLLPSSLSPPMTSTKRVVSQDTIDAGLKASNFGTIIVQIIAEILVFYQNSVRRSSQLMLLSVRCYSEIDRCCAVELSSPTGIWRQYMFYVDVTSIRLQQPWDLPLFDVLGLVGIDDRSVHMMLWSLWYRLLVIKQVWAGLGLSITRVSRTWRE